MTNYQNNKVSMSSGLSFFLNLNVSTTNLLPGFNALFLRFKVNIDGIMVLREKQETNQKGIKENKEALRTRLVAKAYDVCQKTEAYANLMENTILASEVHFSETTLIKSTDSKLESRALIIFQKANDNITELQQYGITPADLTELQEIIDMFHEVIPSPRTGTVDKKQYTKEIAILLKDNDQILKKMDLLIRILRLSQPLFYRAYQDHRKIIHTGKNPLALIASAMDSITGIGYKGVRFTFVYQYETSRESEVRIVETIVKITAKKGRLNIKNMVDGRYIVTVEKTGLKSQEIEIYKAAGDQLKMVVKMEKI